MSSDWGVSTLNPFAIMQTAVTRLPEKLRSPDHPVFLPEQCMTVEEVVKGYTLNAARTAWREAGRLCKVALRCEFFDFLSAFFAG